MNTVDQIASNSNVWILDWQRLSDDEALERIEWLRENLEVGVDWGVCNDPRMCVLKTESAGVLYRMRWFDGTQSQFDPYKQHVLSPYLNTAEDLADSKLA